MRRHVVYPAFGEQLLNLGGIPDDQAAELGLRYDPNDEAHIRHVIDRVIVPYFTRWDRHSKQAAKAVYAFVLADRDEEWLIHAWETDLPPVSLPDEPLRFAQALWDRLWPGEDPAEHFRPDAHIDADPTICNQMRVAPAGGPEYPEDLLDLPPASS